MWIKLFRPVPTSSCPAPTYVDHFKHFIAIKNPPGRKCIYICITHLNHIVGRTAANLDDCKVVLLPRLAGLLPVPVEVHTRERLHHFSLRVGCARESHGGGCEQPCVEVASEAVDKQLCIGGETLSPSITAAVPTEEREGAGLCKHSDPTDEVGLVGGDLEVGKEGGQVGNTLSNLEQIGLKLRVFIERIT